MNNKAQDTIIAIFLAATILSAVTVIGSVNVFAQDENGTTFPETTSQEIQTGITPNATETETFEDLGVIVTVTSGEPAPENQGGDLPVEELPPIVETPGNVTEETPSNVTEETPTPVPPVMAPPVEETPAEEVPAEAPTNVTEETPATNVTEETPSEETPTEVPPVMTVPETPVEPEAEVIVNDSGVIAEQIEDAINDTGVTEEQVDQVQDAVNETVEAIEGSVNGTGVESGVIEEVASNVTETIDEVIAGEEGQPQEQALTGLENLLTGLVDSQDYNVYLDDDERTALQDNLVKAIEEIQ